MIHNNDLFPNILMSEWNTDQAMSHAVKSGEFVEFWAGGTIDQRASRRSVPENAEFMLSISDRDIDVINVDLQATHLRSEGCRKVKVIFVR